MINPTLVSEKRNSLAILEIQIKINGAGEGNRTLVRSMGSSYSAIELRPPMAEREGFEPPIPVRVCMISSHVHSTRLCHLSVEKRVHKIPYRAFLVKTLFALGIEKKCLGTHGNIFRLFF